jgi:multidrug efflux pump
MFRCHSESAVRRFRPITLTAAAAVLALIPLVREVFWAPMALAMVGALIAATILKLTFLPALYPLAFRAPVPNGADAPSMDAPKLEPRPGRALPAAA